jgi:type III restriction enzyme
MSDFQVSEPILNSPFEEPKSYWHIVEGADPVEQDGRRPAVYFYRDPKGKKPDDDNFRTESVAIPLTLVNRVREQIKRWRKEGYPGATRTTLDLLAYWNSQGRRDARVGLFFAQREAVETIIFLNEARSDFKQGLEIPSDEPGDQAKADGFTAFRRYACKMATGSGKTTVMGMLAAWSILNKVNNRSDSRFSDVVLIVCPNVTIRGRLEELKPELDEASLYRKRDLVPPHLMERLSQGRVLVTNWHVFEKREVAEAGVSAKVLKKGVPEVRIQTIKIGDKNTTARGSRYLTETDYRRQVAAGLIEVIREVHQDDALKEVQVKTTRYVESDAAFLQRILGREVGGKQNILILNDEAHHAYRIKPLEDDEVDEEAMDDDELEEFYEEATIWIDGLDRVHKHRGINFCVDLSATPYFLGRVGQQANRPFPWVVSDFGLIEAIESGLVKIPQLAIRDNSGQEIPGYFNIWKWVLDKLTPAERGGKRANPKPEAILKYAHTPIAMLAGLWEKEVERWAEDKDDPREPVFIIVCKNTKLAQVLYQWLGENENPTGIPKSRIEGFRNTKDRINTIRVDSKVVHETDTGQAKGDETRWMRLTLDTVGKRDWPRDAQGKAIYPDDFEELATKFKKPLHPPGRDVRCIISVGMLTEGWDCNTVTHIVGLRPFMSQLLCEQVVGRGLRRRDYEVGEDDRLTEEVATVFGVPFEVIPYKANPQGTPVPKTKRFHVYAMPGRAAFEIKFPRVEGYIQKVQNKVNVDWRSLEVLKLDGRNIPREVEVKGLNVSTEGKMTLSGPGKADLVSLEAFRAKRRVQELEFTLAEALTKQYFQGREEGPPVQVLFPQLLGIVKRYLAEKVEATAPADVKDLFLAPYYGWVIERLVNAIRPDVTAGEAPELPKTEKHRGPGSTGEVDFWTSKEVREVRKSHLNYAVMDTKTWEQSAAFYLDTHPKVAAWVKNTNLGLAIPYTHNGQPHDYLPDFIVRLEGEGQRTLILETKGFDVTADVKKEAAERWVKAVNADGRFGLWSYVMVKDAGKIKAALSEC